MPAAIPLKHSTRASDEGAATKAAHRASPRELAAMVRSHEIIIELGRNKRLLAALRELDASPAAVASAVEDGQRFLNKRKVKLPAGMVVSFRRRAGGWEMGMVVDEAGFRHKFRYHSERGLLFR
jgi:hypothetical protein